MIARARQCAALGIVLLAVPPAANAQRVGGQDIAVPVSGACPSDDLLRRFPNVSPESVAAGIGLSVVKRKEVALEQSGDPASRRTSRQLPFNTQVVVYGFNATREKLFVRTVPDAISRERQPVVCGWIPQTAILMPRSNDFSGVGAMPTPMQMRDYAREIFGDNNQLNVKAVIHDLSLKGEIKGIEAFPEPGSREQLASIRLFDAFLVFDRAVIAKKGKDDETEFLLLGDKQASGAVILRGWVRHRDIVVWPSRMALQWNPDVEVTAYATEAKLRARQDPIAAPQKQERVDFEDGVTRRLPVLNQTPSPSDVTDQLKQIRSREERVREAVKIIEAYQLASPGQACGGPQRDCRSAIELDVGRGKTIALLEAARRIDLLFLVDATTSMEPYFRATAQAIRRFIRDQQDVRSGPDAIDVRFAVSTYGDYRGQVASKNNVDFDTPVPFFRPTAAGEDPMEPFVAKPRIYSDEHDDRAEAPFGALLRAVEDTDWRRPSEAPLRVIIHIADNGGRDMGKTSKDTLLARFPNEASRQPRLPTSTIVERISENDVVNAMRQHGVIYIPIAVQGDRLPAGSAIPWWNSIFQAQAKALLDKLGEDAVVKGVAATYSNERRETPEGATKQLQDAIQRAFTTAAAVRNELLRRRHCAADPRSGECLQATSQRTSDVAILRLVDRAAAKVSGLSADEVENIYSRDQSIVTIWVPAKAASGAETFRHYVALDLPEFIELRKMVTELCREMGKTDGQNPVARALRDFVQISSDDDLSDLSAGEIVAKRFGIPNLERTDLFSRTRQEIQGAFRARLVQSGAKPTKTLWDGWHERACVAQTFLQAMQDGYKIEERDVQCDLVNSRCQVRGGGRTRFQWFAQVTDGAPVYYVPLAVLP